MNQAANALANRSQKRKLVDAMPIRHSQLRNMHLAVVLPLQPLRVVIERPRQSGNLIAVHHRERLR